MDSFFWDGVLLFLLGIGGAFVCPLPGRAFIFLLSIVEFFCLALARAGVTFFARAKKVTKENTPQSDCPSGSQNSKNIAGAAELAALKQSSRLPPQYSYYFGSLQRGKELSHRRYRAVKDELSLLTPSEAPGAFPFVWGKIAGMQFLVAWSLDGDSRRPKRMEIASARIKRMPGRPSFGSFSWASKKMNARPGEGQN